MFGVVWPAVDQRLWLRADIASYYIAWREKNPESLQEDENIKGVKKSGAREFIVWQNIILCTSSSL